MFLVWKDYWSRRQEKAKRQDNSDPTHGYLLYARHWELAPYNFGQVLSSLGLSYSNEAGPFASELYEWYEVTLGILHGLRLGFWLHYLHSLALKVKAIFAGHLIEVIILQEGLLHHPSGKQAEKLRCSGGRWVTPLPSKLNVKLNSSNSQAQIWFPTKFFQWKMEKAAADFPWLISLIP